MPEPAKNRTAGKRRTVIQACLSSVIDARKPIKEDVRNIRKPKAPVR